MRAMRLAAQPARFVRVPVRSGSNLGSRSPAPAGKPADSERSETRCETAADIDAYNKLGKAFKRKLRPQSKRDTGLHVIVLEGASGVNKRSVLGRLQDLGYATHSKKFVDFCAQHREHEPMERPMAVLWGAAFIDAVDALHCRYEEDPSRFRGGVAFVDRSPLSSRAHFLVRHSDHRDEEDTSDLMGALHRLCWTHRCSYVLCTADSTAAERALSHRYEQAGPEERALRELLKERNPDYQRTLKEVYDEMGELAPFLIDQPALDTSHPTLAAGVLLRWLRWELWGREESRGRRGPRPPEP